jgi:hypothetical protein
MSDNCVQNKLGNPQQKIAQLVFKKNHLPDPVCSGQVYENSIGKKNWTYFK